MSRWIFGLLAMLLAAQGFAQAFAPRLQAEITPPYSGSSDALLVLRVPSYCGYTGQFTPVLRMASPSLLEVVFDYTLIDSCSGANRGRPEYEYTVIRDLRAALGERALPPRLDVELRVRLEGQDLRQRTQTFTAVAPRARAVPVPASLVFEGSFSAFRRGVDLVWLLPFETFPNSVLQEAHEYGEVRIQPGVMRGRRLIPRGFAGFVTDFVVAFASPRSAIIGSEGVFRELQFPSSGSQIDPPLDGEWQILDRGNHVLRGEIVRIETIVPRNAGVFHDRFVFRFAAGSGRIDCARDSGCRVTAMVDGVDVELQVANLPIEGITSDRLYTRRIDPVEGELWELFALRVD